jgi:hypothetical protein
MTASSLSAKPSTPLTFGGRFGQMTPAKLRGFAHAAIVSASG